MAQNLALRHETDENIPQQAQLIALVLDGVTSDHSRRSYRNGLVAFFAWIKASGSEPAFTRAAGPEPDWLSNCRNNLRAMSKPAWPFLRL